MPRVLDSDWRFVFATCLWRIWKRRCEVVFNSSCVVDAEKLLKVIESSIIELNSAFPKLEKGSITEGQVAWEKPKEGFIKINTDGACKGNPGILAAGGLLRDANGQWIVGFIAHLGICTNTIAELQAIRHGLELAWVYGYRQVICEVDAKVAIDFITQEDIDTHPCGGLIADIRALIERDWVCHLQHTLREGNEGDEAKAEGQCGISPSAVKAVMVKGSRRKAASASWCESDTGLLTTTHCRVLSATLDSYYRSVGGWYRRDRLPKRHQWEATTFSSY
ncbi:Polynucleotidyl transferase- ribonuclease H-like superfamily protein [Striga hermonthica]|uniref:Polynucleotidyl transferase- ribonuclease H-like superfamily protein n=1 Tax=Striga hermonthica TaxID=68872 RepID=A0A9N7R153_STRHE|nr:Polynucleotidyl transferase- ribonuclease H-like superfamily protein [Striga hermonthica]